MCGVVLALCGNPRRTCAADCLGSSSSCHRDSIEVNGAVFVYLADVSIDTTKVEQHKAFSDWWIGMGWDARQHLPSAEGTVATLDLVSSRPQLMLEHHLTLKNMQSRLGWRAYSQPWSLMKEEVMDNAKGWILEPEMGHLCRPSGVLEPDSLFLNRTHCCPAVHWTCLSFRGILGRQSKAWLAPSCGRFLRHVASQGLGAAPTGPDSWFLASHQCLRHLWPGVVVEWEMEG